MKKFVPVIASVFVLNIAIEDVSAGLGLHEIASYRCRTSALGDLGPIAALKNAVQESHVAASNAANPKAQKEAASKLKEAENRLRAASEEEAVLVECLLAGKMQKNLFALVRRLINGDTKGATKEAGGFTPWYNTLPADLRQAIRATANAWTNAGDKATAELKREQTNLQNVWDAYRGHAPAGGGSLDALQDHSVGADPGAHVAGASSQAGSAVPRTAHAVLNHAVEMASGVLAGLLGDAAHQIIEQGSQVMDVVAAAAEATIRPLLTQHGEARTDEEAHKAIDAAATAVVDAAVPQLLEHASVTDMVQGAEGEKKQLELVLHDRGASGEEKSQAAARLKRAVKMIGVLKRLEAAAHKAAEARHRADTVADQASPAAAKAVAQAETAERQEVKVREEVARVVLAAAKDDLKIALTHDELDLGMKDQGYKGKSGAEAQEERDRRFKREQARMHGLDEADHEGVGDFFAGEEKKAAALHDAIEAFVPLYPASDWQALQAEFKGKKIGVVERLTEQGGLVKIIGGDVIGSYVWFRGKFKNIVQGVLVEIDGKLGESAQLPKEYDDASLFVKDYADAKGRTYGPRVLKGKLELLLPKDIRDEAKKAKYVGRVVVAAKGKEPAVVAVYTPGNLLAKYVFLDASLNAIKGSTIAFDDFIPEEDIHVVEGSMRVSTLKNRFHIAGVVKKARNVTFANPAYREGASQPVLGDRQDVKARVRAQFQGPTNQIGSVDGTDVDGRSAAAAQRRQEQRDYAAARQLIPAGETAMSSRNGATMSSAMRMSQEARAKVVAAIPNQGKYPVILRAVANDEDHGAVFDVVKGPKAGAFAWMHTDKDNSGIKVGQFYTVRSSLIAHSHEVNTGGVTYETTAVIRSAPELIQHDERAVAIADAATSSEGEMSGARSHGEKKVLGQKMHVIEAPAAHQAPGATGPNPEDVETPTAAMAAPAAYDFKDKHGPAASNKGGETMVTLVYRKNSGGASFQVEKIGGDKDKIHSVDFKGGDEGQNASAALTAGSTVIGLSGIQDVTGLTPGKYLVQLKKIVRVKKKGGKWGWAFRDATVREPSQGTKPGLLI